MNKVTSSLVLLAVQFVLVGCVTVPYKEYHPPRLANREEIARHLPTGVTLGTAVSGSGASVEQELVNVGAFVADDGKLRDNTGKEIYFLYDGHGIGAYLREEQMREMEQEHDKQYEELNKKYRLIVLPSHQIPC